MTLRPIENGEEPSYPSRREQRRLGHLKTAAAVVGASLALLAGGCASHRTAGTPVAVDPQTDTAGQDQGTAGTDATDPGNDIRPPGEPPAPTLDDEEGGDETSESAPASETTPE